MNANDFITKDYRKKDDFSVRINKPNLVRRRRIPKMSANLYVIEDYENKTAFRPKKTNPIQTQFQIGSQKLEAKSQIIYYLSSVLCFLSSVFGCSPNY